MISLSSILLLDECSDGQVSQPYHMAPTKMTHLIYR